MGAHPDADKGKASSRTAGATSHEEAIKALQAEADEFITDEDMRGAVSRSSSRAGSRVGSRAGRVGEQEEVVRLQALLQARDVQLNILMKMLAEADATSVELRQTIAVLESKSTKQ